MMKKYCKFIVIFSLLVLPNVSNCQEVETNYGKFMVMTFLQSPSDQEDRNEVGANNESIDSIAHVQNEQMREKLKTYLMAVPKYKRINAQSESEDRILYLLQTENFYYATWGWRPDDGVIRLTVRPTVLVVIKKDLSNHWDYAG